MPRIAQKKQVTWGYSMTSRILLVEDDYDNQIIITQITKHLKHEIDVVGSAEEAMQKLTDKSVKYDMILIDLRLPGKNGWQLLKDVKEHTEIPELPCVAVTGYYNHTMEREALAAGFSYFVAKPITVSQLTRVFNEVLSGPDA